MNPFSLTRALSRWERERHRPLVGKINDLRIFNRQWLHIEKGGDQHTFSQREMARVREKGFIYSRRSLRNNLNSTKWQWGVAALL